MRGPRGACVGLIARGLDGLEAARLEVERAGGQALVCIADVADAGQVEAAAAAIEERFGAFDVWINNAMVSVFSPVKEMTADEFRPRDGGDLSGRRARNAPGAPAYGAS